MFCTHLHVDHVGWNTQEADGQMGLRIDRDECRAIFCGDAIRSPAQLFQPDISTSTCVDRQAAAARRRAVLEEANESSRVVAPAHFRGRRLCRVRRQGAGFEPEFIRSMPG